MDDPHPLSVSEFEENDRDDLVDFSCGDTVDSRLCI